jgi:hypothetical protein
MRRRARLDHGEIAPPGTQPPAGAQSPSQSPPDDDFIEFLGADDVGDAAWWEFLKKAPPRGENPPPATPPMVGECNDVNRLLSATAAGKSPKTVP